MHKPIIQGSVAWQDLYDQGYVVVKKEDYEALTQKWRPIETAPKDGTRILAAWIDGDGYTIIEWLEYYGDRTGTWCQRASGLGSDCGYEDGAFTHWMPLPEPPKGETNV